MQMYGIILNYPNLTSFSLPCFVSRLVSTLLYIIGRFLPQPEGPWQYLHCPHWGCQHTERRGNWNGDGKYWKTSCSRMHSLRMLRKKW